MKKIFIMLALLLVSAVVSAKQYVECYRYTFSLNVASDATESLNNLISKGFKIVTFNLDYAHKYMIVVYADMRA